MNITQYFISVVLTCADVQAEAQTITGRVVDERQQPVEYANIALLDAKDSSLVKGTLSGTDGRFSLPVPSGQNLLLKVSAMGYTGIVQPLTPGNAGDIQLRQTATLLSGIVVKGNRPLIRQNEDKTVFEVSRMKNIGGMKGTDILKYAPRVLVDETNYKVKVGSKPAEIYVNDRRLSPDEVESYLKGLNASDISRIEVQQNHGADKSADIQGGIIYIYTKQQLGLNGDVGFYDALPFKKNMYTWDPSAHLYFGTEKWNIYGSYDYTQYRSQQEAYTRNDFLQQGTSHISDGSVTAMIGLHTYKIGSMLTINPKMTVGVEFNNSTNAINESDSRTKETYLLKNGENYEGIATADYSEDKHSYNLAASYNWKIDEKGSFLKALFNYNDVYNATKTHLTAVYDNYAPMNMDEDDLPKATSKNVTGNLDFKKKFDKGWAMLLGSEYLTTKRNSNLTIVNNLTTTDNSSFSHYDYRENIAGAYTGITKDFNGKVFVNVSLRIENTNLNGKSSEADGNVNKNYTDWFPYFFISHTVNDRFSYSLTYNRSINRPSFSQLNNYKSRLSEVMYVQGNPNLQRVLTDNVSLAFNFLTNHSVSFSYARTPDTMVQYFDVENGQTTTYSTINFGTNENFSADYSYNGNIFPWWQLGAFVNAFYTHLPQSHNRTHLWSSSASIQNRFTFKKIGTFSLNFTGWLPTIDGDSYMHGQWFLSASYSRLFLKDRLNFRCGVYNIFNSNRDWAHSLSPVLSYHFSGKWSTQMAYMSLTYTFSTRKNVSRQQLENKNEIKNRM